MKSTVLTPVTVACVTVCSMSTIAARHGDSHGILQVVERFDRNRDGKISDSEVPKSAKNFIRRVATDAGFDLSKPLELANLRVAIDSEEIGRNSIRKARDSANPDSSDRSEVLKMALNRVYDVNMDGVVDVYESAAASDLDREVLDQIGQRDLVRSIDVLRHLDVDGDGVLEPSELGPVFHARLRRICNRIELKTSDSPNLEEIETRIRKATGTASKSVPLPTVAENDPYKTQAKNRKYATSLIALYDTDQNGLLGRTEWNELSPKWGKDDRNGNGVLSVDELAEGLQKLTLNSGKPSHNRPKSLSASVLRRLPDGLPKWFLEKDVAGNADGQLQMCEFTSDWSDARVEAFRNLDSNNDGVVVPSEILARLNNDCEHEY